MNLALVGSEAYSLFRISFPVPDFTVEHWGVYEARRLADAPADQFRAFVLRAFGAVAEGHEPGVHGYKGAIPVWVGEADQKKAVTAADVQAFANAMRKTLRYKLNGGSPSEGHPQGRRLHPFTPPR